MASITNFILNGISASGHNIYVATSGFKNTLVFTDVQVPACKIIIALDTGHNPIRYF